MSDDTLYGAENSEVDSVLNLDVHPDLQKDDPHKTLFAYGRHKWADRLICFDFTYIDKNHPEHVHPSMVERRFFHEKGRGAAHTEDRMRFHENELGEMVSRNGQTKRAWVETSFFLDPMDLMTMYFEWAFDEC